jgi:AAA domain, putative AbiEii toxin, Type IV TA system
MYIHSLTLKQLRCFKRAELTFQYPGRKPRSGEPPVPTLANVNLLLGNNGSGKSTLLKGIALALTAPILSSAGSGFQADALVRRKFGGIAGPHAETATVNAKVVITEQDVKNKKKCGPAKLFCTLKRDDDDEYVSEATPRGGVWRQMSDKKSPAFLVLGYAATRRMAPPEEAVITRIAKGNLRYTRVQSLFNEDMTLMPLTHWLPDFKKKRRRKQVIELLDKLLGDLYHFDGQFEKGEFYFTRGKASVPMRALSDGYRAFIAWVSDLLYHVCYWSGGGRKLRDTEGVVMVDEIDLHLHPEWQRTVVNTLSETFPKIQFIFTSHSPLITGSLEWANIWVMRESGPVQLRDEPINGLSADQVLLSPYFGMTAVRSERKLKRLRELDKRAQEGDHGAAKQYLLERRTGTEVTEKEYNLDKPPAYHAAKFTPLAELADPPKRPARQAPVKFTFSKKG